ncbi:hypothetical protein Nmel_011350 [Mimus melanotis]
MWQEKSAAAAPSPVLGNIPPNDGMPGGPIPPGFFQGPPGSQPSPHAQPPPHNPNSMMGPHSQYLALGFFMCAYLYVLFLIYLYIFKLEHYLTLRVSHALILTASPSIADVKHALKQ